MARLRTVFMGTPDFAVANLDALIDAGHEIACFYTPPPRPVGRGHKEQPSPAQARAARAGIEVRQPRSLHNEEAAAAFAGIRAANGGGASTMRSMFSARR